MNRTAPDTDTSLPAPKPDAAHSDRGATRSAGSGGYNPSGFSKFPGNPALDAAQPVPALPIPRDSMSPAFRTAEPPDIEVLVAMMARFHASHGVPFPEDKSRRATLLLMGEPSAGSVRILESGTAPVGYVVLTHGFSLEFGGWHGFIDELFVEAPYRGKGFGSAAVRFAAAECRRRGMTDLLLEADLANEGATRLYRRLGFHEHPRRLMRLHVGDSLPE